MDARSATRRKLAALGIVGRLPDWAFPVAVNRTPWTEPSTQKFVLWRKFVRLPKDAESRWVVLRVVCPANVDQAAAMTANHRLQNVAVRPTHRGCYVLQVESISLFAASRH